MQLPEADATATRARMHRRFAQLREGLPPPDVKAAMARITHLLTGGHDDLSDVLLDWHGVPDFHRNVYEIARRILPGETRTYGEIADELGDKNLSRAVGQALGLNPFAPVVPCHRVLAAGQQTGGFSAHGGAGVKVKMLAVEGAQRVSADGTAALFETDDLRQP
ncbi:methylated-DNA--[protein]-cysteine S-methyltransferase [Variovorax brevis]|uniref:methylated-DNA--[protein]-cysteine S-methyltransferase n=1 Tax=Variovorax brevis TaxID=3053503 RepID=UPI004037E2DD